MKQFIKSMVLCSSLLAALTACSPEKKTATEKVKLSVNEQMQSDELTAAGEQLVAPHTFHLADRAFELALQKNPNDKKAQFYRAFLKRFMVLRGVGTRVQPIVKKYGDMNQYNEQLKRLPNSPIRDFLMNPASGATSLQTEEDVQNLLNQYKSALQDFRTFVAQNQDLKLDLYVNPLVFANQIQENDESSCKIIPGSTADDAQLECDKTDIATVKVNVADLLVMKQEAAGEILYLTLYTSYNLNGATQLAKDLDGKDNTAKDNLDLIQSRVSLKLLKGQSFTAVRSLGSDLGVAAKWVLKYQDSVCPKDKNGMQVQRKGFLVPNLCVDDATLLQKNLAILDQVLKGPMAIKLGDDDSTTVPVTKNVNFLALFDKPVQDLRALAPATWSADGMTATSMKDKTFGGLLPDGDADSLFNNGNK